MTIFQIEIAGGTFSTVSHKDFFEVLNTNNYLYYKGSGKHIALLPTDVNAEIVRICNEEENAESLKKANENRCRDKNDRVCRYQHDVGGKIIRNQSDLPVYAKCTNCPRNGIMTGAKENCCIRNSCMVKDCKYCPHPRECHAPHSLEWLSENNAKVAKVAKTDNDFDLMKVLDVQSALEHKELLTALATHFGKLSSEEQAVLTAIYSDKLSRRAYSQKSGIPATTVNRIHDRALKALKKDLEKFF
jgi:hypothetical protein